MGKDLVETFNRKLDGVSPKGGHFLNHRILEQLNPSLAEHPDVEFLRDLIDLEYAATVDAVKERNEKAKELYRRAAKVLTELSGRKVY